MAIRNIVKVGDDILNKKCRPVTDFNDRLFTLLEDMHDTLTDAHGAGLAAPQVGILRRLALVMVEDESFLEIINPEIIARSGMQEGPEGCLSVKGKFGTVQRFMNVDLLAENRDGETFRFKASGFFAKAIQHEYDHLEGILYIDKATNIEGE
jgi:peptide deformylase